jgi:hydrophobic/amphiphilic exporter-1 (mainly G- bacteria), HAE1 family
MNISSTFIERPVATILLTLGLGFFGALACLRLPVSDLPNVDFPTIQVTASLPGASPETMATAVATPLEKQFSTIASLDSMSSVASEGTAQITMQFALDRNIDAAAQDVQTAIATASKNLPSDMPAPPSFRKVNPADSSVIILTLSSATLPLSKVDEYAENLLAQRISTLPDVAQVQVGGQQKYAVRVQLDPNRMAAMGLGIDEVSQAVQNGNVNLPTGTLNGSRRAYQIQASGQLLNAEAFRPLTVAYRNGAPVRLEALGNIIDATENDKMGAWVGPDQQQGIILMVSRQPGSNAVELADSVRQILPTLREQLPAGLDLRVMYDRSQTIRASVSDVRLTLMVSVVLVVIVIFLFLRSVRAAFIPSIAIPLSLAGTFAVMYLMGFSIDNLSLMALTLSIGFIVDDAIVMLENISRHVEEGLAPMKAALQGAGEIGFTILSMTISLAAVFIPLLFMGGIVGRLFHEFAITIVAAILMSGVVALTLTPMLCSRLLKAATAREHAAQNEPQGIFERTRALYGRTLSWTLARPRIVLVAFGLMLAATGYLFSIAPKGFTSGDDTGILIGTTEAASDISFESMSEKQSQAVRAIAANRNVQTVVGILGGYASAAGLNNGRIIIPLKAANERPPALQVVEQLRRATTHIPGLKVYIQNQPALRIGGMTTKSQYQYSLLDADMDELLKWVPPMVEKLRAMPGFEDVNTDLTLDTPKVRVDIDRDRAAQLGVTANQIEDALFTAYGSRQVSTMYAPSDQYAVIIELEPQFQRDPAALGLLNVRSSSGALVPLDTVATLRTITGPASIQHVGQLPSATISFNLQPGTSLSQAVTAIDLAKEQLGAPATLLGRFQGTAQAFQSSIGGMPMLLLLAVVTIYLVLGVLYESAIHPLTILSGLPAAGLGALVTLLIFGVELDLFAMLGLVLLIGVVKKNAIMMVDFALDAQRTRNLAPRQAILEASILRFRPIMMTTFAALAGTLPIALGWGASGASRRPLGLAVVGGLVVSQLLTLYVTPVIYVTLDRLLHRKRLEAPRARRLETAGEDA